MPTANRIAGALFGAALGDALGAQAEFVPSASGICERWPPAGPEEPTRRHAGWSSGGALTPSGQLPFLVTDDTQMMLAVGDALLAVPDVFDANDGPAKVTTALRDAFTEWLNDPRNHRAPGNTCLAACQALERDDDASRWAQHTVIDSKGCGANMRVQSIGLLRCGDTDRAGLAQLQAAMTHGHPTALAAADITAYTLAMLAEGRETPETLLDALRLYALDQASTYHTRWLGDLWRRTGDDSPESFIARGWRDIDSSLKDLRDAMASPTRWRGLLNDDANDPCVATGDAWVAEEAFATGLLCFLLFPHEPMACLRRAVVTRGDSDSIACLAGAFVGAYHGVDAWPATWVSDIEYKAELDQLVSGIAPPS
ncbi:MAG: ADP-ribosylglycohydrolase [Bradymonadia bacterium]|jgi:ADP-ribosylglycohydrolase